MPYIGRSTITGNYIKCSTLTPDGSTTTFTLTNSIDSANVYPGSENSMIVSVSGVIQNPGSAYTINNNQIVFSTAPGISDTIDFIIVLGDLVSIGAPSDGTVTNTKLASSAITGQTAVTSLQDADLFLVYDNDAGALKKVEKQYVATSTLTYTNGTATGDGSTVAITIDSGRAVNDVLVSVNGFILTPTTDYTISGTTLTFVTAPASSAEINIRYLPLTGSATYTNGEFTGDGSTTGITIDSGRSVEDVLVTVNGVVLVSSTDYSISGTTLTFTTAPAASAEISVRYLRLT